MTDLDDLIARLRSYNHSSPATATEIRFAIREAAAALEALRAENERLREALRGLLVQFPPINWTPVAGECQATVSVASLAVASAAITPR